MRFKSLKTVIDSINPNTDISVFIDEYAPWDSYSDISEFNASELNKTKLLMQPKKAWKVKPMKSTDFMTEEKGDDFVKVSVLEDMEEVKSDGEDLKQS